MRLRWIALASLVTLAGCGTGSQTRNFSVYFQPYSAELDKQAKETAETAAQYAQAHAVLPVAIEGYSAPADPGRDIDGLSAQRADAIKRVLTAAGVSPTRISTSANGSIDPHPMPQLSVRRVDIAVGGP
jgi:outer membrane protein OmpA-like peptidoglycan-associated protein